MTMKFLPDVKLSEGARNQKIFLFRASLLSLTLAKISWSYVQQFPRSQGCGTTPSPQMLLLCQKEQMLLTVNTLKASVISNKEEIRIQGKRGMPAEYDKFEQINIQNIILATIDDLPSVIKPLFHKINQRYNRSMPILQGIISLKYRPKSKFQAFVQIRREGG